jgi:hypothetical protein
LRAHHAVLLGQVAVGVAWSGRKEATLASVAQFFMQAVFLMSGLPPLPRPLPGHMPWSVVMPLRLGMSFCTSAMLRSDKVKFSGTTSAMFSM